MPQDVVDNSNLSLKQRVDLIKEFLLRSNVELFSAEETENGFVKFDIKNGKDVFSLHILPKNIVNSGWAESHISREFKLCHF